MINLLGIHLTLLIGRTVPTPAPLAIIEALQSVKITHTDQGPSGFELAFHVGRATALDLMDYRLLTNPLLQPFNRVIVVVRFAIAPQVLMDGIVTNQQLAPSNEPGASTLTITGEDVSVMMDMEEQPRQFPALPDFAIVNKIILEYKQFGLIPVALPTIDVPLPTERVPQQPSNYTDRGYLQELARRYGFLFYVTPGPAIGFNTVHWGPPERLAVPQSALSVNMGPSTNVESVNFRYNALAPNKIKFASGGTTRTIDQPSATRIPMVRDRAELARTKIMSDSDGLTPTQLENRAQGLVDHSLDEVVTATGELDALRYNGLLQARGVVGVRGVGKTYDGRYYVKSVSHTIQKGKYTQSFTLTREGTGTLEPFVAP